MTNRSYLRLGLALTLSFIVMLLLTYSMIWTFDDFYLNLSNTYMAVMMVAPMGLIMLGVMWIMFKNRALNVVLTIGFAALFVVAFVLGRQETFIGNEQFLKSMIPHHSRAILVCERSDITDPEIIELCAQIVESQQEEIDQMKQILERYE
ncbi:DUF305 domain-containing protein [Solwaraspora sp. WMMD406]|uniref:DUF305 domain-containing protein n=1 Tax=Solwaraspora sp. WMMD406 TaxID=3016095 RepID=UPI002416C273|nr:DUF305 domain-containing protein [Solwaraspora sp. WMMD406]MDG4765433.1 DUF305 domain-containing protein [Solwaraspora sp. WMMD406]